MRQSTRILLVGAALTAQMFSAGCQGLGGLGSLFGGGGSAAGDLLTAFLGGGNGGLVNDFTSGGEDFGDLFGDVNTLSLLDDLGWPGNDDPGIGASLGGAAPEYVGGGGLGGGIIHNPEPGSIALFATGLAALSCARRKKRRQA